MPVARVLGVIDPVQPPLPLASKFPFHPAIGSQYSILISESEEGLEVTWTRQNAGRLANTFAAWITANLAEGIAAPSSRCEACAIHTAWVDRPVQLRPGEPATTASKSSGYRCAETSPCRPPAEQ